MGSKFSRAMRPHVSSVAPARSEHHDIAHTTANEARQDPAPRLTIAKPVALSPLARDDCQIATSTTPTTALQRRNSAPAIAMSGAALANIEHMEQRLAVFEQFIAEHRLRSIEYEPGAILLPGAILPIPPPPPTGTLPYPLPPPASIPPPAEIVPQCVICCTQIPKEKDANYTKEVIKPCRSCNSEYCTSCIKKMFIDACNDSTRMPPRCCVQINLHHARPLLSQEEAALFRERYEEWSTSNPMYCPVPTCSAFIPERLLPRDVRGKDKQRVDSGVGLPAATTFACPTCEADICATCRQVAHPNINCEINEFGLDAETAALLKSWGYKRCPKCSHGLKRMFGCNHMECRCGAHFCYVCLKDQDHCNGGCYEEDEENYDSDAEPDDTLEDDDTRAYAAVPPIAPVGDIVGDTTTVLEVTRIQPAPALEVPTAPQPIPRPRNLDGGSARYWENADLDFGEEPSNDYQDRAWDCHHSFSPYQISLSAALTHTSHDMECVKCWATVHPHIEARKSSTNTNEKTVPASAGRARPNGVGRARDRARRGYVPPRGLFRADATIGTAPHLTATILPLFQSLPVREMSPMEDIQFTERIMDTYGKIITTSPVELRRRTSLSEGLEIIPGAASTSITPLTPSAPSYTGNSKVFPTTAKTFSLAHECFHCRMLVCEKCMADALAAQQTNDTEEDGAERDTQPVEARPEDDEENDSFPVTFD